ncbi:VOC family protein [Streptomyces sp. NPDC059787]|uniref:VOC family protein n=1 Tax=Streptomyces sp. NPDC059787 TaxID=3346947 RepID=UPI003664D72C
MGHDIARLHHVGHIVEDMTQAISLYERLGFVVPPPSCPAMPRREGAAPEPFGAANTHAGFAGSLLELATCVEDGRRRGCSSSGVVHSVCRGRRRCGGRPRRAGRRWCGRRRAARS